MNTIKNYIVGLSLVGMAVLPLTVSAQTAPLVQGATCWDFSAAVKLTAASANDPVMQSQIQNIQSALASEGFATDAGEQGKFGKTTRAAIKAFQVKYRDDILAPFGLKAGTGFPGAITRLKLQALYGCRTKVSLSGSVSIAVSNLALDSNGVSATVCNNGKGDLPTAPFRIRLNGINRDFEAIGAQKAGGCTTDTWKYETWGLSYDPGSTFTAVSIIDPFAAYKSSAVQYPFNGTSTLAVPALPGFHLSVRSVLLKTGGLQATFCNLGTSDLTSFPVRITLNGVTKDFDVPEVYKIGKCQPKLLTYDNWSTSYTLGKTYNATVVVDPANIYAETNEFDNVATVIGTP